MSILERRPSYRKANKGNKERQGPTLRVRFTETSCYFLISRRSLRPSGWEARGLDLTSAIPARDGGTLFQVGGGADYSIVVGNLRRVSS